MYPPAYPHDELESLYPGVYLLHGSIRMGPGLRMNRNMVVLQHGQALTLINPVRMSESGLASLEKLGDVRYILRLGDFHGLDDGFYLDRYGCEFWAQEGQGTYKRPTPTTVITPGLTPPVPDAEFFVFESARFPEAALLLKAHKLLITTDSVQYHKDWSYFSRVTKFAFRVLGFKPGLNIGPPWLKRVTPKGGSMKGDFAKLLALDFEAVIAAHGRLLETGAREALRRELQRVFK